MISGVSKIRKGISPELRLMLLLARKEVAINEHGILEKPDISKAIQQVNNWGQFLHLADQHRVYPLVYKSASKLQDQIPAFVIEKLKSKYQKSSMGAVGQMGEMASLANLFNTRGIPVIFVKGPHLAQWLYGDISLRPSKDMDLYLDCAKIADAILLMREAGYRSTYGVEEKLNDDHIKAMRLDQHIGFHHPVKKVYVELHWRLTAWDFRYLFRLNEMLSESHLLQVAGARARVISPEDLFVYLLYHGCKHVWSRLRWLADIVQLLHSEHPINWQIVAKKIKENQMHHMLGQALILCDVFFDISEDDWPQELRDSKAVFLSDTSKKLARMAFATVCNEVSDYGLVKKSLYQKGYYYTTLPTARLKLNFGVRAITRILLKPFHCKYVCSGGRKR